MSCKAAVFDSTIAPYELATSRHLHDADVSLGIAIKDSSDCYQRLIRLLSKTHHARFNIASVAIKDSSEKHLHDADVSLGGGQVECGCVVAIEGVHVGAQM